MDALNERSAEGMGSGRIPRRHFLTSVVAAGLWRSRAADGPTTAATAGDVRFYPSV